MTGDTPAPGREHVQALIAAALDESTARCARCKVCDSQINAVVRAVWPLLESAGQAEAKLAEVRQAVATFLTVYGPGQGRPDDLAEAVRQVLDRDEQPA